MNDPMLPLLAEWKRLSVLYSQADKRMIDASKGSSERAAHEAEFDLLGASISDIESTIATTRATSLAGIVGKMAMVADEYSGFSPDELNIEERIMAGAFDDLKVITTAATP